MPRSAGVVTRTKDGRMLCSPHARTGAPMYYTQGCEMCEAAREKAQRPEVRTHPPCRELTRAEVRMAFPGVAISPRYGQVEQRSLRRVDIDEAGPKRLRGKKALTVKWIDWKKVQGEARRQLGRIALGGRSAC